MEEDTITIGEFKMWLSGFIQGKEGRIPDLEDWKEIKRMLDRVKDEKKNGDFIWPYPTIPYPTIYSDPPYTREYYISDGTGADTTTDNKITIGNNSTL